MAAAQKAEASSILWVAGHRQRREHGVLAEHWAKARSASVGGNSWDVMLHVHAQKPEEVFWAAEQAAQSNAVSLIVAETAAPDFTMSRRLSLISTRIGLPIVLLAPHQTEGATAAQARWRVAAHASLPNPYDPQAPGEPLWQVTLERCRCAPSQVGQTYFIRADHEPLSLHQTERMASNPVAQSTNRKGKGAGIVALRSSAS